MKNLNFFSRGKGGGRRPSRSLRGTKKKILVLRKEKKGPCCKGREKVLYSPLGKGTVLNKTVGVRVGKEREKDCEEGRKKREDPCHQTWGFR